METTENTALEVGPAQGQDWGRAFWEEPYYGKLTYLTIIKGLIIAGLLVFSISLSAQYYPEKGDSQYKSPSAFGMDTFDGEHNMKINWETSGAFNTKLFNKDR